VTAALSSARSRVTTSWSWGGVKRWRRREVLVWAASVSLRRYSSVGLFTSTKVPCSTEAAGGAV
jgi:hypothetical protein